MNVKNMEYLKETVFDLLEILYTEDSNFSRFLETRNENYWYKFSRNFYRSDFFDISLSSGATKAVIIPNSLDYVIKIPFITNSEINYCAREAEYYSDAKDSNIEELFCECFYLEDFCGVPIYLMEKVSCDETEVFDSFYNYLTSKRDLNEEEAEDYMDNISENTVVYELTEIYYNDKYDLFWEFCSEHEINDIHAGNVGFRDNGQLVIIDYSGFHG